MALNHDDSVGTKGLSAHVGKKWLVCKVKSLIKVIGGGVTYNVYKYWLSLQTVISGLRHSSSRSVLQIANQVGGIS